MAYENTTFVLGIPIPSADPVFLTVVGVHVLFGLAAVITGPVAMLSKKGRGRHSKWGTIYFWCLFGVFVTMSVLSFMRWAENYHLFILGCVDGFDQDESTSERDESREVLGGLLAA